MLIDELRNTLVVKKIHSKSFVYRGVTIEEALNKMLKENLGAIAVLDQKTGQLIGFFSDRNALIKIIYKGRNPKKEIVDSIITANPEFLESTATMEEAFVKMYNHDYRYLPVVENKNNKKFLGFIQARDFMQFLAEVFPEAIATAMLKNEFKTLHGA